MANKISPAVDAPLLDTAGTGGDGAHSLNISTAAAFVIAGAGYPVAKHGNRAASSKCGSADVLEASGVNLSLAPEKVQACIEEIGIGFMFAPLFHPAMKHAIGPRRELGQRTIFNILGPLTNPANSTHQLIGVYDPSLTETMAEVLGELGVEGFIDLSGLLQELPPDLPPDVLIQYPDQDTASQALAAGEIDAYYVIPADYLETGEIYYTIPEFSPFSSDGQDWMIRWSMLYNITGGDIEFASYVWHPMEVNWKNLSVTDAGAGDDACLTPGYGCGDNPLIMLLPLAVLVLFFVFISASSGLMLRSVSGEKQNRTMETLLLSMHPRQMLTGKVIGLGIVAVLQVLMWFGSMFVIMRFGGNTLNLPPGFTIPTSLIVWGLLFFIPGYVIYASLMAGMGAMVPDIKAASQVSIIVILPLLTGYMLSVMPPVQNDPNGLLATVLSIFPLTTPPVMMMRLTVGGVPTWQHLLAITLMLLTAFFIMRAVAGVFRAQTIMDGQPFSPKRFFSALLGRA